MNLNKACDLLELTKFELNDDSIKKAYRKKALQYHPDKCKPHLSTTTQFSDIHDAYEYLMKTKNRTENSLLSSLYQVQHFFINGIDQELQNEMLQDICTKLLFVCEKQSMRIIEEMDKPTFCKIYKIYSCYKPTFHFSLIFETFMENKKACFFTEKNFSKFSDQVLSCKMSDSISHVNNPSYKFETKCIQSLSDNHKELTIHPTIDDVLSDNVYQYCFNLDEDNSNPLIIPLWHNELMYDISNLELTVNIVPKMPDDSYWIDEYNTLHQKLEYSLESIWEYANENEFIEVFFGQKRFIFFPEKLMFQPLQTVVWKNEGIALINTENIFDVSQRGDIVLHISIINEN
jgi:hypothetical protein